MTVSKEQKKRETAWTFYDWANSVFSLTITTAIFPAYYEAVTKSAAIASGSPEGGPYMISLLGYQFKNTALFSYTLSAAFLILALIVPILSGIADAKGAKKRMMQFFCYLGSAACISLYLFDSASIYIGIVGFLFGVIGYAGSINFYNAFLPEITTEDRFDKVSARGYALGYLGSVLLLIFNLIMVVMPELFFNVAAKALALLQAGSNDDIDAATKAAKGYYEGLASKISFITVGLWWAGFAQITFRRLPKEKRNNEPGDNIFLKGFQELGKVWQQVKKLPELKRYLLGFFFASMGLQTVMYVATLFGSNVLNLPMEKLILTVLIIQIVAIGGAYLFSWLSSKMGNIYTLLWAIAIWILVCFLAYTIQTEYQFYGLATLVGLIMGGIQSMFRSTYAKLIPDETPNHASYFGFYDASEKLAVVFGTFAYGFIDQITGSMRNSTLALATFFIVGILFIAKIKNFKIHRG